ncbi:MFS transporter [Sabulicella glaciei]|uniref:MFS transporter n=1 Tax=Sabulicella glaciei TaxID=2984948 RepID=A0ABT3NUA2_9PROT|nr:MFS transporter [Roseococcus sp. MDT2-1-1]MCW8085740.1 MFS transporter [Roseococcus sp. MDT2-1-1]
MAVKAESRRAFLRAFPAVALAIFTAAIDQTITATALPAMAARFGEVERISWVVVAYLIAATVAAPVFGRLGDAFGRRRMMVLGFLLQGSGALAAAFAPNFEMLLLARLVHGIGGGALLTLAMAVVGESLPPRERGQYQAYLVACFMSASALGPTVGGWLTEHYSWQAVFLLGLPLALIGLLATTRLPRRPGGGGFSFDAPGVALFTLFVVALVAMLDRVQRLDWALAAFGVAFAGLALVLLLRAERRAPDPLLPLSVLGEATVWRTNALSSFIAATLVAMISFLPLYLSVVRGVPIATVGLMLLPMSMGGGLGALSSGLFMARTGRNMLLPSVGLAVSTLILCFLSFGAGQVPLSVLPWLLGLVSVGFGTSFPAVQTTVQVAAGPGRLGTATASVQFMRNLGAAAGTALLGALLFGTLALGEAGLAERVRAAIQGGRAALGAMPEAEQAVLAAALAEGFRSLFAGAAVMGGVATVLAWRVPLRRI